MKEGLSGYATLTMPLGVVKERDTFSCGHCNRIRHVEPGGRYFLYPDADGKLHECEYTRCGNCSSLICEQCIGKDCTPLMKAVEQDEARAAARRSYR